MGTQASQMGIKCSDIIASSRALFPLLGRWVCSKLAAQMHKFSCDIVHCSCSTHTCLGEVIWRTAACHHALRIPCQCSNNTNTNRRRVGHIGILWGSAGSQEALMDTDLEMSGPPQNSRQRMVPPDVQADLDDAVSQST